MKECGLYSSYSLLFRYSKTFDKRICINGQETMEEMVLQGPVLYCILNICMDVFNKYLKVLGDRISKNLLHVVAVAVAKRCILWSARDVHVAYLIRLSLTFKVWPSVLALVGHHIFLTPLLKLVMTSTDFVYCELPYCARISMAEPWQLYPNLSNFLSEY